MTKDDYGFELLGIMRLATDRRESVRPQNVESEQIYACLRSLDTSCGEDLLGVR